MAITFLVLLFSMTASVLASGQDLLTSLGSNLEFRRNKSDTQGSLVGFTLVRRELDVPAAGLELTIPLTEGTRSTTPTAPTS